MTNTLITSEVGFDAAGKQSGFLRLPYSQHRSACGPTMLMMAGNHSHECGGQIALNRLAHELNARGLVCAYTAGVLELYKDIGDAASKGKGIGLIHQPETPEAAPEPVAAPHAGIVLAKRTLAQIRGGDALLQIAAGAPA